MVTSTDTIEIPNELDELGRLLRGGWDAEARARSGRQGIPAHGNPRQRAETVANGGGDGDGGEGERRPCWRR
jgi:hypothetical protein